MENLQGTFIDHIISDPREFNEIVQKHKESGNPEPQPLDRSMYEELGQIIQIRSFKRGRTHGTRGVPRELVSPLTSVFEQTSQATEGMQAQ